MIEHPLPMTKLRRRLTKIFAAIVATALLVVFVGPSAARFLLVASAAAEFRDSFNTQGYAAPVISTLDWSVRFGGEIGREKLNSLTTDSSIKEEARRVLDAIDRGACRWYLQMELDEDLIRREARPLFRWILQQNVEMPASIEFAAEQQRLSDTAQP